jgi:hypothetical protein
MRTAAQTILLLLALNPIGASAYNDTIHFFSTLVTLENTVAKFTVDEMKIVAFCAQLPDETIEFDAVEQYRGLLFDSPGSYWRWARADFGSPEMRELLADTPRVSEMVSVHHLLHGLTGGTAANLLKSAELIAARLSEKVTWTNSAPADSDKLCAFGFALHLLGDAVAHRKMGSGEITEPGIMYGTGLGHAGDGTQPDRVLKSGTGLEGWTKYSKEIADARGCEVRQRSAANETKSALMIKQFETEIKADKNHCAILLVTMEGNGKKASISGISSSDGFTTIQVNENNYTDYADFLAPLAAEADPDSADSKKTIGISSSPLDKQFLLNGEHSLLRRGLDKANDKWFGEDKAAREAVLDLAQEWARDPVFSPSEHNNQYCQLYVNEVFPKLAPSMCVPSCKKIWEIYSEVAIEVFDANNPNRQPFLTASGYQPPDMKPPKAPVCPSNTDDAESSR